MLKVENANMDLPKKDEEPAEIENTQNLVKTAERLSDNGSCSTSQQEVISESEPINLHTATSLLENHEKSLPEFPRRVSRTEAVKQDAMKLKTATLERMGRMFKQRTKAPGIDNTPSDTNSENSQLDITTRKQKTNSLGRMLKLVEKDGSPKKLFVAPRSGSLSRILRRHPPEDENSTSNKTSSESTPGMFSRMLSQLRGRPNSGNKSGESRPKDKGKMSSLPPKVPYPSRGPPHLPPSPSSPTTSLPKQTSLQKAPDVKQTP